MAGCLLAALTYFPLFQALTDGGQPGARGGAGEEHRSSSPPTRRSCSFQGNPVAREIDFKTLVRHRQALPGAELGQLRQRRRRRPARRRTVTIGDKTITPPAATVVSQKFDADSAAKIAAFKKEIGADADAAGYPAKAKPIAFMSGAVVDGRRDPAGSW